MRIKVFTTGGSLDKGYSTQASAFVVLDPTVGEVLRVAGVNFEYEVESLFRKDSLEMGEADRELVVSRVAQEPCDRILITHGTDTMVETARCLGEIQDKTIVLTGAMQPATFKDSDGPFNIGFAVAALQTLPPGVYLAMNGQIFDPEHVRKDTALDRFEGTRPSRTEATAEEQSK